MILILRGHIRTAFNDNNLYNFLKTLSSFYGLEIYIHTWSIIQSHLSWRILPQDETPVTESLIHTYFRDLQPCIKHIIIDDDTTIANHLIGSTEGILIPGMCPIPRIAWKNYWYGKYRIIDHIKNTSPYLPTPTLTPAPTPAPDVATTLVVTMRFDFFHVNQLKYTGEQLAEFICNHIYQFPPSFHLNKNIYLKNEPFQGIDNFYIGSINTVHRLAHHFHHNLDTILDPHLHPQYQEIGHWEYIVYHEDNHLYKTTLPKKIWILWLQGFENAPALTKKVFNTWKIHNPTWEIITLDLDTIYYYLDFLNLKNMAPSCQAFSDYVRVNILKKFGGVWIDATMACTRPLDSWVYEATAPANFWMYHGRDYGRGPASWFMISMPESLIATQWADAVNQFLTNHETYEFFWLDRIFSNLALNSLDFLNEWKKVPYLWCEDPYSAHSLAGIHDQYNPELIDKILASPTTFAVKLSNHPAFHEKTNSWLLLEKAQNPSPNPSPPPDRVAWKDPPSFENADFFTVYNY